MVRPALAVLVVACFALCPCRAEQHNFDNAKPGELAKPWLTIPSEAAWRVEADPSAPSPPNVLAALPQSGGAGRRRLAILDSLAPVNGELTVRFKPTNRHSASAAGLVWRYNGHRDYYVLIADAANNTVEFVRFEGGTRVTLAPLARRLGPGAVKHPIPAGAWSILHVHFKDRRFRIYFDHRELFDVQDSKTPRGGRVGLWASGDSVIEFDDFEIKPK